MQGKQKWSFKIRDFDLVPYLDYVEYLGSITGWQTLKYMEAQAHIYMLAIFIKIIWEIVLT